MSLNDASILVTGGTGSFGTAFLKHCLERYRPRRLIVFSRDELKQSELSQALGTTDPGCLRFFIGDVRDRDRLEMAMRGVDLVVHAAALKQVTAAEYNPFECIQTNVIGAENVVHGAIRAGVKKVIALSTDKAASPINLYGASKLASDKIFTAANHLSGGHEPRFAVVRYGNVLNSRGSVVPVFARLLADGATSLPITDPRMTRFCITLQQAVDFVVSCLDLMRGGEVFVPKIPSMSILDVARALGPAADHRIVGIRPGEKLHETLITSDDARATRDLGDRFVIEPSFAVWDRTRDGGAGTPVGEDFHYASDTNDAWLSAEDLRRLLQDTLAPGAG